MHSVRALTVGQASCLPFVEAGKMPALPSNDWLIWQLADSAFPIGSFAHSTGLEAAWQCGQIRSSSELHGFIEATLTQSAHAALPFVLSAYDSPERLAELDRRSDAFISNHVANRASRLQGQALAATFQRIFDGKAEAFTKLLFHYAPVFGVVMRLLDIERETACRLFFFTAARGLISAAVRLGIVGPMEGQGIQSRFASLVERLISEGQDLSVDDVAQTSPIFDICHGMHDRLYSRLFQT